MNLAFVCVGAGRGVRFGGDKLAEMLGSRTVFATALGALCLEVYWRYNFGGAMQ